MNRNTFLHDIWVYLKCLGHGMYRRHFYGHQKPGHQKPGRLTSKQLLFSQLIPPLANTLVRRNNTITSWHMDVKKIPQLWYVVFVNRQFNGKRWIKLRSMGISGT